MIDPMGWFTNNPVDVIFSFGGLCFLIGGTLSCFNKKTRVPRENSLPTAIILSCYLIVYFHLATYMAFVVGIGSAATWWFLFFKRYVGMDDE